MTEPEVADRIVAVLNGLLECDREAISTLVDQRVPCNAALVAHPTCQVGRVNGPDDWRVGLLGVLNAVAGARRDGRGYIAAEWAPDGTTFIQRFVIRPAVP